MLSKPLAQLTLDDIAALVANGVAESRYLDFKSEGVGSADKDKREFLADITAFANAVGGDIVFGVATHDGAASANDGIELADHDKEKLRLGDLIRTGTEPRLANFNMAWLPTNDKRGVLVVRVPRSWNGPHRVTLQGHDKFYVRNSAGKHPMNVHELRTAFTLSEVLIERIRRFHAERVRLIHSDGGALALQDGPKLVLHVIPLSAFTDPQSVSPTPDDTTLLAPFGASGWNNLHTLDGFATHTAQEAKDGPVPTRSHIGTA